MFSNQLPPPSASVHSTPDIPRPLTTSTTTKATAGALFLLLPPACSCQLSCSSSCIVTCHSFNNRIRIRFDSRTWEAKTGEGQEKAHERAPQEAPQHVFKSAPTSQRALHFHPTASPSAADVVSQPLSTSDPAYHTMTETPKPGLTLRPLVVAILPGHSYSGYHTPQACFKRASSSPHSRPRTWLITSNPTTYDLRSSVHFCNQRTPLVATKLTFRGPTCSCNISKIGNMLRQKLGWGTLWLGLKLLLSAKFGGPTSWSLIKGYIAA